MSGPGFPDPDLIDHLPIRVIVLLTSTRLQLETVVLADGALRNPVFFVADQHRPDHPRHLVG